MTTLRPYQTKAVNEILACLQRGIDPLFVLPTGGGKTECFVAVSKTVVAMGWSVGIFVHRKELLRQASARLIRAGIEHGIIAPGHELTSHRVHVASIDTIGARLDLLMPWLRSLDLAIADEAQHAVANKWNRVLEVPRHRFGVTATPCRTDGKGLGETGLFRELVLGPSIKWLTLEGYLAPAHVYAPPNVLDLSTVARRGGDYAVGAMARAVEDAGLAFLGRHWYATHTPGQPAVMFCPDVASSEKAASVFRDAGWRARSVDGSMSADERDAAIGGLADGSVQVLTSCDLIGEGVDIPAVSSAILARPTQSTGLCLQQQGRVLRLHADKSHATILDLVGNSQAHGLYLAERQWDLNAGVKGLERAVAATWRCRKCFRVHEQPDRGGKMLCGCGSTQTVSGFASAAVENHPPIAGVSAETLLRMKFKDAVALLKTKPDLVTYGTLRGFNSPHGWAANILDQRAAYRGRYRPAGMGGRR